MTVNSNKETMIVLIKDQAVVYLMREQIMCIEHNTKTKDVEVEFVNGTNYTYGDVNEVRFNLDV